MTRSVAIVRVLTAAGLIVAGLGAATTGAAEAQAQARTQAQAQTVELPQPGQDGAPQDGAPQSAPGQDAPVAATSRQGGPTAQERLDALFETLLHADAAAAEGAAHGIQSLWSQSGSDSMDFLLDRGRKALDAEDYDKAVAHFTALVTLAPDFAEGWNMRATAYFLQDELWRSMADIQRALALEPRHFGALTGMAAIFSRIGSDAEALTAARAALAINPHLEEARKLEESLAPEVDGRDI